MSKLYATINSDSRKTLATSRGHKHIDAHVRGWDCGILVTIDVEEDGAEVIKVFKTGGSNSPDERTLLNTFRRLSL